MATSVAPIHFLVAAGDAGEIGAAGSVPWPRIDADMKHFVHVSSKTTDPNKRNAIVMGRTTWDSLPASRKPLPNRLNIVLSRGAAPVSVAELAASLSVEIVADAPIFVSRLEDIWALVDALPSLIESLVVIGGSLVFGSILTSSVAKRRLGRLYLTKVRGSFPKADTFIDVDFLADLFPVVQDNQIIVDQGSGLTVELSTRVSSAPSCSSSSASSSSSSSSSSAERHEEEQYLDLIREIIETGVERSDRTGVGTRAFFGKQMKFSLRDGRFPLLTTKTTFFRGIAEELLWFIKGSTNAKELAAKKIHIWDANGSREFLDSRGLTSREEGDLGPVYGFQWRHFGAKYVDMHTDYTGQGFDQLADCIHKLRTNPTDRRIIMSAWNPADLQLMALPPCHMFCQFFVANGELSCLMYQRSCDMGLGVPFNIASYALLTIMIAQVCDLKPGDFIHCLGDTHVYLNHIEPLKEQLTRSPYPFPTLTLDPSIKNIDDFSFEHINLQNYKSHARIPMQMAV